MDEKRFIGVFDVEHDDLVFSGSILLENSLLLVEVILIGKVAWVEIPPGVKTDWFLVLFIDGFGFLWLAYSLCRLWDDGTHSDHGCLSKINKYILALV